MFNLVFGLSGRARFPKIYEFIVDISTESNTMVLIYLFCNTIYHGKIVKNLILILFGVLVILYLFHAKKCKENIKIKLTGKTLVSSALFQMRAKKAPPIFRAGSKVRNPQTY